MAEKLTKNEKREASREKARLLREQELKARKIRGIWTKIGVIVGILAVIGIVAGVVLASNQPAVAQINPKNMLSNGVLFNGSTTPVSTPAIDKGANATPTSQNPDKVNVVVYLDYSCPYCKKFEAAQSSVLENYVKKGDITVEYHPLAFLSNYSVIAANASACIASDEPEKWWDANTTLYANQPDEAVAKGWGKSTSVKNIKDTLKSLNLSSNTMSCISDLPYTDWAGKATSEALSGPLPNSDSPKVQGTPYVIVDGKFYPNIDYINDPSALTKAIEAAQAAKQVTK